MPVNVPFSFDSGILVIINDILLSRKEECHALSARTWHYSVWEEIGVKREKSDCLIQNRLLTFPFSSNLLSVRN